MISLFTYVRAVLATRDRGASAAEYALLLFGVAAVIAAVIWAFGGAITDLFNNACDDIQSTNGTGGGGNC
jgi:pilus assembly protein Flp/PilA